MSIGNLKEYRETVAQSTQKTSAIKQKCALRLREQAKYSTKSVFIAFLWIIAHFFLQWEKRFCLTVYFNRIVTERSQDD